MKTHKSRKTRAADWRFLAGPVIVTREFSRPPGMQILFLKVRRRPGITPSSLATGRPRQPLFGH
jgi:hypothetical protein